MRERAVAIKKLPTTHTEFSGNRITLHAKEYNPKEITDPESLTIVIPGWSMQGNTPALKNIATAFAEKTHSKTITLSSTFARPHPDSLEQQSESLQAFIKQTGAKRVTIVAYSEGSAKALKLAADLERQKEAGVPTPEVEGLALISPLGLAEHQYGKLTTDLIKAGLFHIPLETIKGISQNPKDVQKFFEAQQAAMAIFRTIGRRALRRGPVRYIRQIQQELTDMATPLPEVQNLKAPVVVVTGEKDTVVPQQRVLHETHNTIPHAIIVPISREISRYTHHGMPFQEYGRVAEASIDALRIARRTSRRGNNSQPH